LKLKTSPLFLLSLFSNFLILGFTCLNLKASEPLNSSTLKKRSLGLIETAQRLQNLTKDQIETQSLSKKLSILNDFELKNAQSISLNQAFLKDIFTQSDPKLLSLAKENECTLYSMLDNDFFKSSLKDRKFLVDIVDSKNQGQRMLLTKDEFVQYITQKKCFYLKEHRIIFDLKNVVKTLEGIPFSIPKTQNECKELHGYWLKNPYTPNLCKINLTINDAKKISGGDLTENQIITKKEANFYTEQIPSFKRVYLENLCQHLDSPEKFCQNYLKNDVWNKVLNAEAPTYKMSHLCENALGLKSTPKTSDLLLCAQRFNNSPETCQTKGMEGYPGYFPKVDCDQASSALKESKLQADYHDCPGNSSNLALVSIHRIINHFYPEKIDSNIDNCDSMSAQTASKLFFSIKNDNQWPLNICYFNRIEKKETCTIYIPGDKSDESLSEDKVVSKILYNHYGALPKTFCQITDKKKYNPIRNEFKQGCFIVNNFDSCTAGACEKVIYLDQKKISNIRFEGSFKFDLFPTAFKNERYSTINLFEEVKKIQSKPLRNINEIEFHLNQNKNGIVFGLACIEDLLPEWKARTIINQCQPIPFLITGTYLNQATSTLKFVILLSTDDLSSPRIIEWERIFNGVSHYSNLHPLSLWTMYGLKK